MSSQQPPCRHCCSLDLSKLCKHVRYKSAIHADESPTNTATATTSSPSYSMYDHAWSSAVVTCRGEPWSTAWSGLGSSVCDCMCTQCVCAEGETNGDSCALHSHARCIAIIVTWLHDGFLRFYSEGLILWTHAVWSVNNLDTTVLILRNKLYVSHEVKLPDRFSDLFHNFLLANLLDFP